MGLFNLSDAPRAAAVTLEEAGLSGEYTASDAWTGREVALSEGVVCVRLGAHEGTLVRMTRR